MISLHKDKLISTALIALLATGGAPAWGASQSEREAEAARQFAKMRAEIPLVEDRATIDYVHCVTVAVIESLEPQYRDMNWELAIFDSQIANAFVLPGGKIGVFEGLLDIATNQHQLAAVLGHEAAHAIAGHTADGGTKGELTRAGVQIAAIVLGQGHWGLTNTAYGVLDYGAQVGFLLPHSREQETEADELGLQYMANAGFDPRESVELWKKMSEEHGDDKPPEFLSTHPADEKRIDSLISLYPQTLALMNEAKDQGKEPSCARQ